MLTLSYLFFLKLNALSTLIQDVFDKTMHMCQVLVSFIRANGMNSSQLKQLDYFKMVLFRMELAALVISLNIKDMLY